MFVQVPGFLPGNTWLWQMVPEEIPQDGSWLKRKWEQEGEEKEEEEKEKEEEKKGKEEEKKKDCNSYLVDRRGYSSL